MRLRKLGIRLIPLFLIFAGSTSIFPQQLSLQQAVSLAKGHDPRIKQYAEKLEQRKSAKLESWGNFLPSLQFEGTYNHFDNPLEMDLNPIKDVIVNIQAKNMVELSNIGSILAGSGALNPGDTCRLVCKQLGKS